MSRHKGSDCRAFVGTVTARIANAKKMVEDIDANMTFRNAAERDTIHRQIDAILEAMGETSAALGRASFYDYQA
jgi:hypothetical protein